MSYIAQGGEARFLDKLSLHFQGVNVGSIKPGQIRDAARKLYPTGASSTWNRQVIVPARAVINHAHDMGWCSPIRVPRFKERQAARTAVDHDWIEAFITAANERDKQHIAALALILFQTGCRISEAIERDWNEVNLDARTIQVPKTKNGEPRTLHLTVRATALLRSLPHRLRPFRYLHRWSVYKPWKAVCAHAGLPYVPPHQAGRHSLATYLNSQGVDPRTVMDAVGWKSVEMYMGTYVHSKNAGRTVADLMENGSELTQPHKLRRAK